MKLLAASLLTAATLCAQNPMALEAKAVYEGIRNNITRAADKMPEENYSFKPTPDVRSFGQLIGHVADAQYLFCSQVKGEQKAPPGVEKSKTTKADLAAALKEAFAYCDAAHDGLTDAQAMDKVKLFGRERSKLGTLYFNSSHNNEHYGNIVTYMRLKGLVPPSSERRP
jgi:uncharacterized damage-inducible protein DinB